MTLTTTPHRLTVDEIKELQAALVDTTLECYHFKEVVHPNGDGALLRQWTDSLVVAYDVRSFSMEEIMELNNVTEQSTLFRWWCNRITMATRSTSIDPARIDEYILSALDYTTGSDKLLGYSTADLTRDQWQDVLSTTPIIRVIALWNILRIPFETLLLSRDNTSDEQSAGTGSTGN